MSQSTVGIKVGMDHMERWTKFFNARNFLHSTSEGTKSVERMS